jgi:acyl-CoA thioester hydrolase
MAPEVSVMLEQVMSTGGTASDGAVISASSANAANATARVFEWPIRVYWEDTDAGGVVYHSIYLNYFERCRSEYLRAAGVLKRELREQQGIQFVVVDMNVRWARAAQYDDQLVVTAQYVETRGATCTFRQTIHRNTLEGEVVATAECRAATIDARSLRPVRMPKTLLAAMEAYSAGAAAPEVTGATASSATGANA